MDTYNIFSYSIWGNSYVMKNVFSTFVIFLYTSLASVSNPNDVYKTDLSIPISQKSIDTIIYYEVGGKEYYNKNLTKPTVPAWQTTSSGVTIGFGFDCGYNTPDQIRKALTDIASENEIKALQSVSGLKGKSAYYNGLPKVKYTVNISYEEAEKIFKKDSLPRFTKQTSNTFNLSYNRLHPHSNGALVSLVFNRGPLINNSNSRKEMKNIKTHLEKNQDYKIPNEIKSMKRLWDYNKLKGLHLRRDAEANLFQEGLNSKK